MIINTIRHNHAVETLKAMVEFVTEHATVESSIYAEMPVRYDNRLTFWIRVDAIKFMNIVEYQFRLFAPDFVTGEYHALVDSDDYAGFKYALGALKQ